MSQPGTGAALYHGFSLDNHPYKDGDEMVEATESKIRRYQAEQPNDVVCVCGSMKFFDQMLKCAHRLTLKGNIVLLPLVQKDANLSDKEKREQHALEQSLPDGVNLHVFLDAMHRNKIDMADRIVVVTNFQNYIGDSTKAEISYAIQQGKGIEFDKYGVPA